MRVVPSLDLRVRVMADVDPGLGTKATAEKYRVSPDWVRKLKCFRRQCAVSNLKQAHFFAGFCETKS